MLTFKSREFFPTDKISPENATRKVWLDGLIVVLLVILSASLMARFNLSEALVAWYRSHENFQMDEWPGVLLTLTTGLIWYGLRRKNDLQLTLNAHQQSERRLSEQLKRNQELHLALLDVQEKERSRLARELHDELGQYLSALKMDLSAVKDHQALEDGKTLEHALKTLSHMQIETNRLLRQLRPAALDELGLTSALDQLVESWRSRMPDSYFQLEISPKNLEVSEALAITLLRITQEALTNVAKHSRAGRVEIVLRHDRDTIRLQVADDGLGIDPDARIGGFGLAGIAERVQALNGKFGWSSQPGEGFSLQIELPVEESDHR
jgi:two-component system sensor histidine kinase UhpB